MPLTESSDEDEASGDEGLPNDDSDVSCKNMAISHFLQASAQR